MSFEIGSIVRLRSGGPSMTVLRIVSDDGDETDVFLTTVAGHRPGDVACVWFDGVDKKEGVFPPETLEAVTSDSR